MRLDGAFYFVRPLFDYPAAVPARPFCKRDFSSVASLVGGRQALPVQTNATALSFGR